MTRTSTFIGVVGAIALGIVAPAFADSQLAASAGLTDEQAAGMTLTEIAQYKFNRDESVADRWAPSIPPTNGSADPARLAASAGIDASDADGMTLTEIAAVKFNHDTRADDHQSVTHASGVTIASRSIGDPSRAVAQLIASAGLSPSEARGMSLSRIAAYKFDRDTPDDN
jgi:antitoxin component of RelBE/YafQ-DinJ toxin-antitoxin module